MDGSAQRAAARRRLQDIELGRPEKERETPHIELSEYKYPVLTLPDDIVSEILLHCLPPYPDRPPLAGRGSPTHLLGICRLWRVIALSTPRLWWSISWQPTPDDTQEYCERALEMVQLWLDRSGSIPLSIFVDFDVPQMPKGGDEVMQAVVAHRSRWEYANLRFVPRQASSISGSAPQLAELVASVCQSCALPRTSGAAISASSYSQIEILSLANSASPSPALSELALEICEVIDPEFQLVGAGPRTQLFLKHTTWTLPALKTLQLGEVVLESWAAAASLVAFVERCEAGLECLRIIYRHGYGQALAMDIDSSSSADTGISLAVVELRMAHPEMVVGFRAPRVPLRDIELWVDGRYF
uniref:F-box domain-containing protein n=1 Tax=Mycena chlorophos TaxID=658473 RepID=A0ABQ0M724_MYCCL|nr:predicted protein [Mycena chlorophos]